MYIKKAGKSWERKWEWLKAKLGGGTGRQEKLHKEKNNESEGYCTWMIAH